MSKRILNARRGLDVRPVRLFGVRGLGVWGLGVLAALAFALAGMVSPASAQQGGRAAPVEVDSVVVESLSQTVPVIGRLVTLQRGTVAARTQGPVADVMVSVGDRVAEGDTLVRLDASRLEQTRAIRRAEVNAALAGLDTARSELQLAQEELQRLERLKGSVAFSKARYDDKLREVAVRRAQIGEAEANVARSRADFRLAEIDVERSTVFAPFPGVVVAKHTERGAYLTNGEPVVTIINDNNMEVEADVPANRLSGLTLGREVEIRFSGGGTYTAAVRAVVPEENALTRTRAVRFIPNIPTGNGRRFADGQTVTVEVPVGEAQNVVTVHKDAVINRGNDSIVYLVEGAVVNPRMVELGEPTGPRFVVLNGLEEGDVVVTKGNERLRPGQPVTWPGKKDDPGSGDTSDEGGAGDQGGNAAARKGSAG